MGLRGPQRNPLPAPRQDAIAKRTPVRRALSKTITRTVRANLVPEFMPRKPEGPVASTIPDVQVPQHAPEDAPTIDWVWFAPRGNVDRWKQT